MTSEATWMTQLTDSVHLLAEEDLPPVRFHHNIAAPLFPIPVAPSAPTAPSTVPPPPVCPPNDLIPFAHDEHKENGPPTVVSARGIDNFISNYNVARRQLPKYTDQVLLNLEDLIARHYKPSSHLRDVIELIKVNLLSAQVAQLEQVFSHTSWWTSTKADLFEDFGLLLADEPAVTLCHPSGVWRKGVVGDEVSSRFDDAAVFPIATIRPATELFHSGHTIEEIQQEVGTAVYSEIDARTTFVPLFLPDDAPVPAATRPLAPVSLLTSPTMTASQLLSTPSILDFEFGFESNALGLTGMHQIEDVPSDVGDGDEDDDWKSVSSDESFVSASEGNSDVSAEVPDEARGHGMSSIRMYKSLEVVEYLLIEGAVIAFRTGAELEAQGLEYKDKKVVRKELPFSDEDDASPIFRISSLPTLSPSSVESFDSDLPRTPPSSPVVGPIIDVKTHVLPTSPSSTSLQSSCVSPSIRSTLSTLAVKAAPIAAVVNEEHVQGGVVAFSYPLRASIAEKIAFILERRAEDAFEILERQEQAEMLAESPLHNVVFLPGSPRPCRTPTTQIAAESHLVHYPETSSVFVDVTVDDAEIPFYCASHLRARRITDPKWTPEWEEALNARRLRAALALKKNEISMATRLIDAARALFN